MCEYVDLYIEIKRTLTFLGERIQLNCNCSFVSKKHFVIVIMIVSYLCPSLWYHFYWVHLLCIGLIFPTPPCSVFAVFADVGEGGEESCFLASLLLSSPVTHTLSETSGLSFGFLSQSAFNVWFCFFFPLVYFFFWGVKKSIFCSIHSFLIEKGKIVFLL